MNEPFDGTERILDNGARLWAKQLSYSDSYFLGLGLPAGSECDPNNRAGLAHFLEHVALNGGKKFGSTQAMRQHLRNWTRHPDGRTSRQSTIYSINAPREVALFGLEVMPTILLDVGFHNIETQRTIIQQERANAVGYFDEMSDDIFESAMVQAPDWQRSTIGTEQSIDSISLLDLQNFYHTWYRSSHIYGVIVGPANEEAMLDEFAGALSKHSDDKSSVLYLLPPDPIVEIGTSTRRYWQEWNLNFTNGLLCYSIPIANDLTSYCLARMVCSLLYQGGNLDAPLKQAIREKAGLIYSLQIATKIGRGLRQLFFQLPVIPKNMSRVREIFEKVVMDKDSLQYSQFAVCRSEYINFDEGNPSSKEVGNRQLTAMLNDRQLPKTEEEIAVFKNMQFEDVQAFAQKYLRPERWRVAEIVP